MAYVDRELQHPRFTSECTAAYLATIRGFILEHVALRLATIRESRGMFGALECAPEWDAKTDLSLGASGAKCARCPLNLGSRVYLQRLTG